jgi:hypothetical protein
MNWDAIGAIGEILGATAVFASLIYLAIQIRTQNRESRLGAMHDVSIGMRDLMSRFGAADMAPIVLKANENFDQLTDEEALRFITLAGQYFLAFEEAFTQYQEGRLTIQSWHTLSTYYTNGMGMPGIRRSWVSRKKFFGEEFVRYIDEQEFEEYTVR